MTQGVPPDLPKEGDILLGKYRVERVLGVGGMGVVVAAHHVQLDEHVAIKFLLPEALENPDAVARFTREARAAAKIRSEHVARVTDVGALENGSPYMIMEYLEGRDLADTLEDRGTLGFHEAVGYVLQASEAIAEAHSLGIVHRDLKPANLFLTHRADGSPSVKVLDFGISKVTPKDGELEAAMTRTTAIMGSPLYMSPEQMASTRNVDLRTDIYALGVILHELLTSGPVFRADTMPQLCAMILQEQPPPLRDLRPEAPPALEAIILKCLAKSPHERYSSVAELAVALLPFTPPEGRVSIERIQRLVAGSNHAHIGEAPEITKVGTFVESEPTLGSSTASTGWSETQAPKKSSRGLLVVGLGAVALMGLLLIGGGIVGVMAYSKGSESAATATSGAPAEESVASAEPDQPEDVSAAPSAAAPSESVDAGEAEAAATNAEAPAEASAATPAKPSPKPQSWRPKPKPKPKPAPGGGDLFGDRK